MFMKYFFSKFAILKPASVNVEYNRLKFDVKIYSIYGAN